MAGNLHTRSKVTEVTDMLESAAVPPTIVLVHEAFADASSWAGVIAFGLDAGECVLDITSRFAPTPAADAVFTTALPALSPGGPESELYIRKERFPQVYAADLPPRVKNVMSVAQRPIALSAVTGRSGPPAWVSIPS
ncbi:hypothetical protein ACFRR7_18245 [Streptomyces sp. NPDC056909]|uniref:hypothetical protein n=1 Tax=Streptomyces sp. NPDC056909 TaxID=3345963 RepID=UPI00367CA144